MDEDGVEVEADEDGVEVDGVEVDEDRVEDEVEVDEDGVEDEEEEIEMINKILLIIMDVCWSSVSYHVQGVRIFIGKDARNCRVSYIHTHSTCSISIRRIYPWIMS